MEVLQTLDAAQSAIAKAVFLTFERRAWDVVEYRAAFTPTADVWSSAYDLIHDGGRKESVLPTVAQSGSINSLAHQHWRLTQELGLRRWYKMTVKVQRTGHFNVEFEYRDQYREGDIMREQG